MKHLNEYIVEMILNEEQEEETAEQRKKASDNLLAKLNEHSDKLEDFVKALDEALKEADKGDNAKIWMAAIKDLFDGENGDQYKAKNHVAVPIAKLYPTQSEIDITNSAKWAVDTNLSKGVYDMFSGNAFGAKFPVPVLVYQSDGKNWIIDGHHRWSQVGLINPKASLDCMVVTGPESVQDFLKITQGAIAAVIATDNGNNGKEGDKQLPVGKAKPENNIFGKTLAGDKIKDKIVEMLTAKPECAKIVAAALMKSKVMDQHGELVDVKEGLGGLAKKEIDSIGTLVMNNRDLMVKNGQAPEKWSAPRPVMPQSDAAGPDNPKDAKNGNPDVEGSALYAILHKGKFPKIGEK